MPVKNPLHPGKQIRVNYLENLGLTVTTAAKALGVTRQTLNNLVNEKSAVSPEMAVRLEKIGWGTADDWLCLQMAYDLSKARLRTDRINVHPICSLE